MPFNKPYMNCVLCNEANVEPDHEISEKHIRNKTLHNYSANRKQFSGNRKGVVVSCHLKSSYCTVDSVQSKIKISAKPDEEVKFNFRIKNDNTKDDIVIIFVQMTHKLLNFEMNNHGMELGCNPVTLKPKTTLQKEVSVKFKSPDVGQYEMPLIFSFRKPSTNEGILIMRDLVVFVEKQQTVHEKIASPYAQKEVKAEKLIKTTQADRSDDMFLIPKNYKVLYAHRLNVQENYTIDQIQLCKEIKDVFVTGVAPDNYIKFFHNLLWYEETIVRINLKKYNMSGVPLMPQGKDSYALVVPGLGEKRPSLMLGDLLFIKPHNNEEIMFEAVIGDVQENIAVIRGLHPNFHSFYKMDATFDVRFFMSRMPLERMHIAVNCVVSGCPEQERVFPVENKTKRHVKSITNFYNVLVECNPEQRSAVEHIVAGTSGSAPYLVHGPPGTGKTVTIVEAILQLVQKNEKNRVLVCTDSNMAADHVAVMLLKYLHMLSGQKLLLRANSKYRVWETMPHSLRKYSNGDSIDNFVAVSVQDFKAHSIVVTTLSHAAKFAKDIKTMRANRHITHLFIDEAGQASEPACLIPVCGLLTPRGALVLAGDPLQLGPVVISHHARKLGLGLSLMERLKNTCELYSDERSDPHYMVMLRNNFRSDADILHIPNELFYNGQLRALASVDPLSCTDVLGARPHSRAIVFHGVLSKEQRMGKSPSYFNSMELEIVQMYITNLVKKHKVLPDDIGVVTPYIRQVYKIKNWLAQQNFGGGDIEVGTVEAFQGKEKRVIIISTVRANCGLLDHDAKFQLGFLVDDKRFNVALTRAKAKAIIIGNPLCLQNDIKWRTYIQRCRDLNTYHGYDAERYNNADTQKDIIKNITPVLNEIKISNTKA